MRNEDVEQSDLAPIDITAEKVPFQHLLTRRHSTIAAVSRKRRGTTTTTTKTMTTVAVNHIGTLPRLKFAPLLPFFHVCSLMLDLFCFQDHEDRP